MNIARRLALAAGVLSTVSLASCSGVLNQGGDTTCKTFLSQDENTQNDEINKMLKDKNQTDPNGLQTMATRNSVIAYCKTLGNDNSQIKEAPHI